MNWESALPPLIGFAGVIAGSAIVTINQFLLRKEQRRETLRAAYAHWLAASDMQCEADQHALNMQVHGPQLFPDPKVAAQEAKDTYRRNRDAHHAEIAAFSHLLLLDPCPERRALVDAIRKIAPFNTTQEEATNEPPSVERFDELLHAEAVAKGKLAIRINGDLSGSV